MSLKTSVGDDMMVTVIVTVTAATVRARERKSTIRGSRRVRVKVVGEWNGITCRNVYSYNETDFDCSKIVGTVTSICDACTNLHYHFDSMLPRQPKKKSKKKKMKEKKRKEEKRSTLHQSVQPNVQML